MLKKALYRLGLFLSWYRKRRPLYVFIIQATLYCAATSKLLFVLVDLKHNVILLM